jgi:RNA polymerase sigma-70 factor (ECF subfamily)
VTDCDPLSNPEQAIRRLYGYVAYRIGAGPDAEDVVSEAIERALRYRDSYDERKGSSTAWLAAIASRVIADRTRDRGGHCNLEDAGTEGFIEDFSHGSASRIDLHQAMALLDDRARELLALRYGADLRARDIASLLGQRTNTVEVALHRALARLRGILEERPPAPGRYDTGRSPSSLTTSQDPGPDRA